MDNKISAIFAATFTLFAYQTYRYYCLKNELMDTTRDYRDDMLRNGRRLQRHRELAIAYQKLNDELNRNVKTDLLRRELDTDIRNVNEVVRKLNTKLNQKTYI